MDLPSADIIIRSLQNLLKSNREKIVSNLVVKNHPSTKNSKKHLKIIKKINNLLLRHKN